MLKAMEMRTVHWTAREVAQVILTAAAAAILARVQPEAGLAPFALAFLAAAMLGGLSAAGALAGALTAMFHPDGVQWMAAAGAGTVVLGAAAFCRAMGSRSGGRDGAASLLAGLAVLIAGAARAAEGGLAALRVLGMAAAAAASAPFFRVWMNVRRGRRHLLPEERTGLAVLAGAILAGLMEIWPPLGVTGAMLGVLIAAPLGAGAAACAGLGGGAVLVLSGLEPVRASILGACGMLAGLAPPKKRWLPPLILSGSAAAAFLMLGTPWTDAVCAAAASGAVLGLPEAWTRRARLWMAGENRGACDPDRLAMRLRADSERKLRALSDAFGEMSEGYRIPADVPDEQSLIGEMRDRLCENCSHYAECWVDGDNRAVRFLCQLISEAIDWANNEDGTPLFGDEMPPHVLRQCLRGEAIPQRLGGILEEFAVKRRAEMKRGAVNQLISAQFMQAQMLLRGLADVQARPMRIRGRHAARARAALDRAGIETGEVMALRGAQKMEIVAQLARGCWSPELAQRAAAELSGVFGREYAASEGVGGREAKFIRLPKLRSSSAASCHSGREGVPCGDSHVIRVLEGDRLLLMISDGMGSGEAAARESAQTLRLLERFLEADVSRSLALETVNELMLARTDSDMFATVDLCLVDLGTGAAEFSKLAACRSLILRRGEILTVEGGRLPLGILEGVRPSVCRVQLQPGDVIVLASDGVMDAVPSSLLCRCLLENGRCPPQLLAESLVNLARTSASHPDDMTVLCTLLRGTAPKNPAQGFQTLENPQSRCGAGLGTKFSEVKKEGLAG